MKFKVDDKVIDSESGKILVIEQISDRVNYPIKTAEGPTYGLDGYYYMKSEREENPKDANSTRYIRHLTPLDDLL